MSEFAWKALELLLPILASALTAAVVCGARWLAARTRSARLEEFLSLVASAVEPAVREVEQTMTERLKAARADGKLTDEEKAALLQAALRTAKQALGPRGAALYESAVGAGREAFDDYLRTRIESEVHDMRR